MHLLYGTKSVISLLLCPPRFYVLWSDLVIETRVGYIVTREYIAQNHFSNRARTSYRWMLSVIKKKHMANLQLTFL